MADILKSAAGQRAWVSEEDCLQLLLALLARLPKITLVVDAKGRTAHIVETVQKFRRAAAKQSPGTVVKILVVGLEAAA